MNNPNIDTFPLIGTRVDGNSYFISVSYDIYLMSSQAILTSLLQGILTGAGTVLTSLLNSYGYLAVFVLMTLESASAPIPSEIVLPLAGLLAAQGAFNIYLVFVIVLVAGIIGITIDYYIAYYLEKDVVYRHLKDFHIKQEHLDAFDRWFERNGAFTVFIGRLLPEIRGLVSLPAGFAKMPLRKFYGYSIAGMAVWDIALLVFGYYALNAHNAYIVMIAVAIFAVALYALYRLAARRMAK